MFISFSVNPISRSGFFEAIQIQNKYNIKNKLIANRNVKVELKLLVHENKKLIINPILPKAVKPKIKLVNLFKKDLAGVFLLSPFKPSFITSR